MKKILPLVLLFSFGLLATGCSLGGSKNNATAKKPQVRVWRVNQDIDTFRNLIKDFQQQKGATVTYKKNTLENYEFKTLKSMASRQGPDIWSFPNDWLGDEESTLITLHEKFFWTKDAKTGPTPAEAIKTAFPAGIAEQIVSANGKVMGIPTNVDALQLYYNSDIFQAATSEYRTSLGKEYSDEKYRPVQQLLSKPPTTWNILMDQTKYINRRSDSTLTRSAIALGTGNNIPYPDDVLQLLMLQNGAKIVSGDRKNAMFHITSTTSAGNTVRPGVNALDFFTSFSNPGKQNYSWNASMPDALDAFGQGKVAMVIAYSDFGRSLKTKYPRFKFQTTSVPQVSISEPAVNFLRYSIEGVTQTADNSTLAFSFLKAYGSEATSRSIASEQKLKSPYLKHLKADDNYLAKQILTGQSTYKKNHQEFNAAFLKMITDASQNGVPADQAVDTAAETINKLLVEEES